jgi:hypothetical protein
MKFLNKSTNCNAMRYKVFLGIFQQIAPGLNGCIYCLGYCLLVLLASVTGGSWARVMSLNTQRNSRTIGDVGLSATAFK